MTSLLVTALLAAQLCPPIAPPDGCPQVYRVLPDVAAAEPPLKILFLGDGFQEADLATYQCSVDRLAREVLASSPFRDYACHIGVYRMDFVDPPDEGAGDTPAAEDLANNGAGQPPTAHGRIPVDPSCTDSACLGHEVTITFSDPCASATPLLTGAAACAPIRLGTALCRQDICRLIWPDEAGQTAALHYATCVPGGADLVVILSNTGTFGGGGNPAGSIALATLTLSDPAPPGPWDRLAHELGHALFGLLDEYEADSGSWSYRKDRNVVSAPDLQLGAIPWGEDCTGGECEVRCAAKAASTPQEMVGVVEGALYHDCGFYRSQRLCRMRNQSNEFCAACQRAARKVMETEEGYNLTVCPDPDP